MLLDERYSEVLLFPGARVAPIPLPPLPADAAASRPSPAIVDHLPDDFDANLKILAALDRQGVEEPRSSTESRTRPFELGHAYRTSGGDRVVCTELDPTAGYEQAKFDDDKWRYNRDRDRGRITGTTEDMRDPRNVIPLAW